MKKPLVFLLLLYSCSAMARNGQVTYLCIEEVSGGLTYNKNTSTWDGVKYKPNGKYLVKVNSEIKSLRTATVTLFGDKEPWFTCKENYLNGRRYHCNINNWGQFIFSQITLRYIKSNMIGYVQNLDENTYSAPRIEGGSCSPL